VYCLLVLLLVLLHSYMGPEISRRTKGATAGALSRVLRGFDRSVAEKHVAIRSRSVALRRGGSVRCAGSGSKQGNGSDQDGKNAFHGTTPLQRLVRDQVRSME
jgi:hypothetical protein